MNAIDGGELPVSLYACNVIKLSAYLFTFHDDYQSEKLAGLELKKGISYILCFRVRRKGQSESTDSEFN